MDTLDWLIGEIKFYSNKKKFGYLTYRVQESGFSSGTQSYSREDYYIDDKMIKTSFSYEINEKKRIVSFNEFKSEYILDEGTIILFKKTNSRYKDKVTEIIPLSLDFFKHNFDMFHQSERNKIMSLYFGLRKTFDLDVKNIVESYKVIIDNLISELQVYEVLDMKNFINEFDIFITFDYTKSGDDDLVKYYYELTHPLIDRCYIPEVEMRLITTYRYSNRHSDPHKEIYERNEKFYRSKIPEKLNEVKLVLMSNYKIVRRTRLNVTYSFLFEQKIWFFLIENGFNWVLLNQSEIYEVFKKNVKENWNKHPIVYSLEKRSEL